MKNLKKIAKKILSKNTLRKINTLEDKEERATMLQYSIISQLKLKQHEINLQIKELEKQKINTTYAKVKASRISGKIRNFQVEYNNQEFYKLEKLFNDIEKEIEDVRIR